MKIIIEEHEDTVSVSYIGKGKKIDRLLLLTLATAETVVDCLIPNLPDKKVREAADCFADDMKAVIISAYEDKASDHKSKLTSKEATFLSKLMGFMTEQKGRACPCGHTDKLKENMNNFLPPEYSTDLDQLQYAGILYYAVDGHGHKFQASTVLRLNDPQLGELIHWLHYHLKGSNPPPALYHLEMLLNNLEYLRGGRHYLYNSIYQITRLEAYP